MARPRYAALYPPATASHSRTTLPSKRDRLVALDFHIRPPLSQELNISQSEAKGMLLFAHTGIALATGRFSKNMDLLFLAIGSMLPDLIDKPLGWMIYGTPNMGRIFAHTLLFLLILAALALYSRDIRIISLAAGVFIHLILDFMWFSPAILLWPLLGSFPPAQYVDPLSYMEMLLDALRTPLVLIPECLGLAYLIYFAMERKPNAIEYYRRLGYGLHRQCLASRLWMKHFWLKFKQSYH